MQVVIFIYTVVFFMSIPILIFWGIPKIMDWFTLNVSKDRLENRAERKVRDLKSKLRVIELESEALRLQKTLEEKGGK